MKKQAYTVKREEKTDIIVGENIIESLGDVVKKQNYTGFLILCGKSTKKLYLPTIEKALKKLNKPIAIHVIDNGEERKSLKSVEAILETMLKAGLDRKSAFIALGGGIIGDVGTLAAGLYYRGIDCIQIPTTLLAQVDSCYGGKGGVNLGIYKNMIGVISQPRFVIIDTAVLKTLPKEQVTSGLGEAVKYGIAQDPSFFSYLARNNPDTIDVAEIIKTCSGIKMGLILTDPLDVGDRRIALNFGHTLGHAVERLGKLPHGLAVAIGIAFATRLSNKIGILKEDDKEKILMMLTRYDLPTTIANVDREKVISIMKKDKKAVGGTMRFVLVEGIGRAKVVSGIDEQTVRAVLEEVVL